MNELLARYEVTRAGAAISRDAFRSALRDIGRKRERALESAKAELERLGNLVDLALESGLRLTEISELSGVSRPTLAELRGREHARPLDLELQLLLALGSLGAATEDQLLSHVGHSGPEVAIRLQTLQKQGLVAVAGMAGYGGEMTTYYTLTTDGETTIPSRLAVASASPHRLWAAYLAISEAEVVPLLARAERELGSREVAHIAPEVARNKEHELAFRVEAGDAEEAALKAGTLLRTLRQKAGISPDRPVVVTTLVSPDA
jgi:transcriptional regulator with XRE-family HTH domain